jgi:hypothetical protein
MVWALLLNEFGEFLNICFVDGLLLLVVREKVGMDLEE